jgi:WD40 repeat protein
MTVFSGHEGPVTSANFSPDGTRLATSSADGSVRIWRIRRGQQLLDYACSLLMRPLTYEQRRQYFLEREPQAPRCGLKPWDN